MFRRAVSTLEYVKAGETMYRLDEQQSLLKCLCWLDAVFSYQLPFNLVAVIIMFPLSFILTPRW